MLMHKFIDNTKLVDFCNYLSSGYWFKSALYARIAVYQVQTWTRTNDDIGKHCKNVCIAVLTNISLPVSSIKDL